MARHRLRKTTGEHESYRERKLRASLRRSGADSAQIDGIVEEIERRLRDGISTAEVYRIAHRMLRRERRELAARYSLKRAIQRLGPDGFPFEEFVAELLRHEGWRAKTGVILKGRFVSHEIDVDAAREGRRHLAECKFKTQSEGKVDVKVALYVHSRAEDLSSVGYERFWIVTNGRFTKDARIYGEGVGLGLLSWDHPKGESLRERIDGSGLHPITALTTLGPDARRGLLRQGVVLCRTLLQKPRLIASLRLGEAAEGRLRSELDGLCGASGAR